MCAYVLSSLTDVAEKIPVQNVLSVERFISTPAGVCRDMLVLCAVDCPTMRFFFNIGVQVSASTRLSINKYYVQHSIHFTNTLSVIFIGYLLVLKLILLSLILPIRWCH